MIDIDQALFDAEIEATLQGLSRYQKVILIQLLKLGRMTDLAYPTRRVLLRLALIEEVEIPRVFGYPVVLTEAGMIAALRLCDAKRPEANLFYEVLVADIKERQRKERLRELGYKI